MRARAIKPSIIKQRDEMAYFRLPKPEMDSLRRIAEAEERPISDIVRRAVRKFLARQSAIRSSAAARKDENAGTI